MAILTALLLVLLSACTPVVEQTFVENTPLATALPTNTAIAVDTSTPEPTVEPTAEPTIRPTPVPYPQARGFTQLVYHPPSGEIVMFGGESNSRTSFRDTWAYDVSTNTWQDRMPDSNPKSGGMSAAYDAESDLVIFYFTTILDSTGPNGLRRISETWVYDVSANTWTNMKPRVAPFGLMGARMAYDSQSDRIVLFGGADFTQIIDTPYFSETWSYDFNTNTWTRMQPEQTPSGRSYYGMAYDSEADRVLIFGGSFDSDDRARADELWAYDYDSDTWEQLQYSGESPADHHPFMVYAPGLNKTLYLVNRGFWAFDYESRSWTELNYDRALDKRHFHSMAFDAEAQKLTVFGGGSRGLSYDNSTWIYDPASDSWELAGPLS